jgi:cell wall-active antibiotic response 4TMS protein YvqF
MLQRRWATIQIMEQPMERPRMSTRSNDPFTAPLLIGVALVTAGALLMRQSVDLSHSVDLARSWPLFVIVLAFAQMVATIKERHQQGWGLLLAGNWLLANTMTNWAYIQFSVPVLLAGLGLMSIIRALRDCSGQLDENHRATR